MVLTEPGAGTAIIIRLKSRPAENGRQAVDRAASFEPRHYDAGLMDIRTPVMDENAATRAIRAPADPA